MRAFFLFASLRGKWVGQGGVGILMHCWPKGLLRHHLINNVLVRWHDWQLTSKQAKRKYNLTGMIHWKLQQVRFDHGGKKWFIKHYIFPLFMLTTKCFWLKIEFPNLESVMIIFLKYTPEPKTNIEIKSVLSRRGSMAQPLKHNTRIRSVCSLFFLRTMPYR